MNKRELKEALHAKLEEVGFPSPSMAQTNRNVDLLFGIMEESLVKGEDIACQGFGTLRLQTRKARVGRNVHTGEALKIPEHQTVKFVPSGNLKAKLNPALAKKAAKTKK